MATSGAILTDFGTYDKGQYVLVQPDGKIVVMGLTSGLTTDDLAIARYNTNGSLDTTFDTDGKLIATSTMTINSVKMLSDGKFLTVGDNGADFALARYSVDGTLDTTFDRDGKVTTNITDYSYVDYATAVMVQADSKLLVVGTNSAYVQFVAVRYNSNGSLDTTFSGDGKLLTSNGIATAVAVQPDGKVVMAGNYNNDFQVVRLNRHGSTDSTFSGDGFVTTSVGTTDSVYTVNVLGSGKILVGGTSADNFALVRYNPDGTLDTTFDTDGKLVTSLGLGTTATLNSIVTSSDGKYIAAGTDGNKDIIVMRFNSDGSLDTTFDTDGKVTTDLGGWEEGNSVVVQSDGKILVAGSSDTDFALVRYNTDGSLDTTFSGSNIVNNLPVGTVTISGSTVKGQILTASNNLTDADGLGNISYQWQAGGVNVGTVSNTYTLTAADIGKTITATAKYTDLLGTAESVSSAATVAVTDTPVSGTAGVTITGTDFSTNEQGDTAVFNIKLNSAPTRDVTLNFTSSDTTEGVLSKSSFVFTSANWATAQTLTITGQNDALIDGNIAYTINAAVSTLDVIYKSVTVNSLTLTNQDTVIVNVQNITGTNGIDILQGSAAPTYMLGEAGDDDLSGGAGNDTIYGSYGNDVIFGEADNDVLYGEQDADYMEGGTGNDTLDGGLGLDTMIGGAGNDTYYLGYDAADVIDDQGLATDVDTVIMPYQLTKYTLAKGIENATITEGTKGSLTGNASNNTLTGNSGINTLTGAVGRDSLFGGKGNDVLNGGTQNDTLSGGTGNDAFIFNVALTANIDLITDFAPVNDTIKLENSIFKSLSTVGTLAADQFISGANVLAAADSNDFLIYNTTSGKLFYDADGNGAGAGVQIALIGLSTHAALTNADFVVI